MLTKASAKFIKSLQLKKYRKAERLFVVEGAKSVLEVLKSDYSAKIIVATPQFLEENLKIIPHNSEVIETSAAKLSLLGSFKTNDTALAVAEMKPAGDSTPKTGLILALDDINDPGNLGTIIRVADWYGIDTILASDTTVDLYNPKVITATKGSFLRVAVVYTDLTDALQKSDLPKFGTFMNGDNIHEVKLPQEAIVVLGNEANGISEGVAKILDRRLSVPSFGRAESLNVAMAAGIICDNFKRAIPM